ncbi:flagellar basal-body MS-ring/collar protein FliF [Sedimenticola sp.]|uniref:flagellar basal-body MS-ring/collar protein FliF n=1 Tax=Sedimenticola sp. TaxID=1940285 RepID=UPI00258CE1E0|nr:flagellar basal-body MS-ring/collar protein FliF [Sedimenticola sp.]MCW8905352.1 flagellar basal-body MS-ring/collar protein FliF [Sedimenticola sp.]
MANDENALTQTFPTAGLGQNPIVRQLGVMIGIAASVALGIAVVLWSQTPSYSVLYANMAPKDATEVIAALDQNGIPYKINDSTGAVMVASGKLQEARMKLAGQGLPHSNSMGYEILQQETGFGTSRALEAARFHRALEGELARTISTLSNIESARVHLATPKQSVFVRKKNDPSASVVLKLYSGRILDKGQVAAIVHLVASSVPELDAGRITVVDHKGNLLSGEMDSRQMMLTSSQFEYTRELEKHYRQRVEDILAPILGADRVRAQVSADVDFTVTEQTSERFNPDLPALRSEQVNEQSSQLSSVQGVPGALSNQPPAAGTAPEVATASAEGETAASPLNTSKRATRNYELDKTISHTRLASNNLRRLSVAVVVDDLVNVADDGAVTRVERTPEEISRITRLVKEAIGFNTQRGDSVEVINSAFMLPAPIEPLPELAIWEEPWVWDAAKQAGGVILVLILIFFVLRPTMKKLTAPPVIQQISSAEGAGDDAQGAVGSAGSLDSPDGAMRLPGPEKYENTLDAARQMVQDDPKRVAQVVRSWVAEDAGR